MNYLVIQWYIISNLIYCNEAAQWQDIYKTDFLHTSSSWKKEKQVWETNKEALVEVTLEQEHLLADCHFIYVECKQIGNKSKKVCYD